MLEADKEGAMAVVDSGVVRCSCGTFYEVKILSGGHGGHWEYPDLTFYFRRDHACPDNRFRWHGPLPPEAYPLDTLVVGGPVGVRVLGDRRG